MKKTHWGIIGPGTIAHNFADGLAEATSGDLLAIASTNDDRRQAFGDRYSIDISKRYSRYELLFNDSDIDALYIATPHPFHAPLAIAAIRAGKAVLCEKPAGMTASEVVAITAAAKQENVFFMEAFMYRCHPQIDRLLEIIDSGDLGKPVHIQSSIGYHTPFNADSRAYNFALGGGGILDVGCYPVSLSRLVAGAAVGRAFDNPVEVCGIANLCSTGVDQVAYGLLKFGSGFTAECSCAVAREFEYTATIWFEHGTIALDDPWTPGRDSGPSDTTMTVTINGKLCIESLKSAKQLFAFEAEYASEAIASGKLEASPPALSLSDSIGNAETLDRWRHSVGYFVAAEREEHNKPIPGVMPSEIRNIPTIDINGVKLPVSQLIMGCDNKSNIADGAIVWDAWMETGGNAFDTAFVYGSGKHEAVLGQWIRSRGVADSIVVTAKGAHTPYCTPRAIASQLDLSLERLKLDSVPIYIMHRDNLDVPVGEFVDALNKLVDVGRIGIYGGSNWTVARMREANAYAQANNLQGFSILNNNLSLAVMEKPVWAGCISSNNTETLSFLTDTGTAHFSWSSGARGFFLPEELRNGLPEDTSPQTCYGSANNEERRRRATELAQKYNVSSHNIATAWVLAQPFASFALIGPRSADEILSTLPALDVQLSPEEVRWLNLQS